MRLKSSWLEKCWRSMRNAKKRDWLFGRSGSIKCSICREYSFITVIGGTKNTKVRYYGCNSRHSNKAVGLKKACFSPYVLAEVLETRVWGEIRK